MSQVKRLGMGLGALLGESSAPDAKAGAAPDAAPSSQQAVLNLGVSVIRPNPFQPRAEFDEVDLRSLAESLKRQGVLQPVVVRPAGPGLYELVAGERRLRAAKIAGFERIPAIVRTLDDKRMLELALIENTQRKDLNPIEKARAFRQLMQLNSWTQDQLADAVGMGRPTVANFVRLLDLPPEVQDAVRSGAVSMGHARALLAVSSRAKQLDLLKQILDQDLSVRGVEKLTSKSGGSSASKSAAKREPWMTDLESKLMDKLGTKVELTPAAVIIPYGSTAELNALLKRLGVM
jgi:ParB family chromosome partitioning protein